MISPARPESVSIPKSLARPGPWPIGPARPMANTGVEEVFESLQLCIGGPRDPPASRHAMEGGGTFSLCPLAAPLRPISLLLTLPACAGLMDFVVHFRKILTFWRADKLNFGGLAFRLTFWSLKVGTQLSRGQIASRSAHWNIQNVFRSHLARDEGRDESGKRFLFFIPMGGARRDLTARELCFGL